jgi:hypothetical protein
MAIWQSLVQIFPLLPPTIQLALVDYAPLPTSVIEKVKEAAAQLQQGQQADPNQLKAETQDKFNQGKLQIEAKRAQADADLGWKKALLDAITKLNVAQIGAKTDTDSANIDAELQATLGLQGMASDHALQANEQAHNAMQTGHDRSVDVLKHAMQLANQRKMQQEQPQPQAA